MGKTDWSPGRYLAFSDERTRPARDLLAQVPVDAPRRVVDVGCGPGNSTELLVQRWPDAEVTGFDTSPVMLEAARSRVPTARFVAADAASWTADQPVDVIFANAVLQWLPDPLATLVRLVGQLAEGGALAVQMPDNTGEPSHRLMVETAEAGPWADRLRSAPRLALPSVGTIYDALKPHVRALDIWHTVYNHPLDGAQAVVDWVASTGLRPFLDPLDEEERAAYRSDYLDRIRLAYPAAADGKVLLRFPRLFIVALR